MWFNNVPVTSLSTVHSFEFQQERLRKLLGKKGTNANEVLEGFANSLEKKISIPLDIDDYNYNMSGIGIADQIHSYYDTQLISFRTLWYMLLWAYDTMVTNTYIIYKDMSQSCNTVIHEKCHLQCAWRMILTGSGPISMPQSACSTRAKSTWSNIQEGSYLQLVRSGGRGHI